MRRKITKIWSEEGYAYQANIPGFISRVNTFTSNVRILENGIPLPGPANALHEDIRRKGGGAYSLWLGTIYFSTSDNSDPRINGKDYEFELKLNLILLRNLVLGYLKYQIYRIETKTGIRASGTILKVIYTSQKILQLILSQAFYWRIFYWTAFCVILLVSGSSHIVVSYIRKPRRVLEVLLSNL
jgi:hypothetical protein